MPVTRRVSLSSAALALVLAPNLAVTQDFSASELTGAFNEEFLAEADGTIRVWRALVWSAALLRYSVK
jgi:hypothetical protein